MRRRIPSATPVKVFWVVKNSAVKSSAERPDQWWRASATALPGFGRERTNRSISLRLPMASSAAIWCNFMSSRYQGSGTSAIAFISIALSQHDLRLGEEHQRPLP
jgi:hypothetical protein